MRRIGFVLALASLLAILGWWTFDSSPRSRGEVSSPLAIESSAQGDVPADVALPTEPTSRAASSATSSIPVDRRALEVVTAETASVRVVTQTARKKRVGGIGFRLYQHDSDSPHHPAASGLLVSGRTDENGTALVQIPRRALENDGQIEGFIFQKGFQAHFAHARQGETADRIVTLLCRAGATARGRILNAAGEGVVAKLEFARDEKTRRRRLVADVDQEGRFDIHFTKRWSGILFAHAEGVGSASKSIELRPKDPPQDLELVLQGPGILRGRVLEELGVPAAGLLLTAKPPVPAPRRGWKAVRNEGCGLATGTTRTDGEGRFTIEGLREGTYLLMARPRESDPVQLFPTPVVADGTELELYFHRPHLVVFLLDADGSPWSGPPPTTGSIGPRAWRASRWHWPDAPHVEVYDAGNLQTPNGLAPIRGASPLAVAFAQNTWALVELAGVTSAYVCVRGAGFDGAPQLIHVVPGMGRNELTFRARADAPSGHVSVRLFDPQGELIRPRTGQIQVRLEDPDSALPLMRATFNRGTYHIDAPPRSYRLVAEGGTSSGGALIPNMRVHGRTELTIQVAPGGNHEYELELGSGARLELRLEGEPWEEDRVAVRDLGAWAEGLAAHADVELLARGRPRELVNIVGNVRRLRADVPHDAGHERILRSNQWPLNETHLSEALPAGVAMLVASLPGGRVARVEIELRSGETTSVVLRF